MRKVILKMHVSLDGFVGTSSGDVAHAGAGFARSLSKLGLVDEYQLIVHPAVLGSGLPMFAAPIDLKLVSSRAFPAGAVAPPTNARDRALPDLPRRPFQRARPYA